MKKKKFIIVDVYELTEEEMKQKDLIHKIRFKMYWYDTGNVVEGGLPEELKNLYQIGEIIYE